MKTCAASTCREPVQRGQLFCRTHWLWLPRALRNAIHITYRHRFVRDAQGLISKACDLIDAQAVAMAEYRRLDAIATDDLGEPIEYIGWRL